MTVWDTYAIQGMDHCIASFGDSVILTTLDAKSGYGQCEVDECYWDITNFISHMGLFCHVRVPFGLKNAPATFRRAFDIILSLVKWQFSLVYIYDVIIYCRFVQEHFGHVQIVLELLSSATITLRLEYRYFFHQAVD